jgi:glycosyltransferase involved in cell wall biosynthesis
MRVAHFAVFSPTKSGMYESTKDQIKYERREGLDSIFVDGVRPDLHEKGLKDDFLEPVNWRLALDANVWVVHSNFPPPLREYIQVPANRAKVKIISIHHGPVEHMLFKEWFFTERSLDMGHETAFTMTHINAIWNWDACIVLNQHEYDISVLFDENDKLIYIPNSIDLENCDPDGMAWEYTLPVHLLFAAPKIVERIPTARLNMLALPFVHIEYFRNIVYRAKDRCLDQNRCENIQMTMNTLAPLIRGADIGFNSNYSGICSRVHMEMQAMGVPVVSYNGDYTDYHAKVFDLDSIAEQIERCWNDLNDSSKNLKEKTMAYARENYDRGKAVKQYVNLYQGLLDNKKLKEIRDE